MTLRDIWYVRILGRHKHSYKRIENGHAEIKINGKDVQITYQMHQCTTCKKIVGLDNWQIADLPAEMLYEKICNAGDEAKKKINE